MYGGRLTVDRKPAYTGNSLCEDRMLSRSILRRRSIWNQCLKLEFGISSCDGGFEPELNEFSRSSRKGSEIDWTSQSRGRTPISDSQRDSRRLTSYNNTGGLHMRGLHGSQRSDFVKQTNSLEESSRLPWMPEVDHFRQRNELKAVNTAVVSNGAIFVAKAGAWYFSGSGALLAESIHSLADIANQLLLRAGVEKSRRAPTKQHPYGFHREKYIYALMSAVCVFCVGSGATIVHGIQNLYDPPTLEHMGYSLSILGISGLIELFSLSVAFRILNDGASRSGRGVFEHIKSSRDPTTSAVLFEDAGAVAGLGVAGVASYMTWISGDPMYDALGSIGVGVLMGGIALAMIRNYKRFLIGQAIEPTLQKALVAHLKADPMVLCVVNPMSEEIGDGLYRCDITDSSVVLEVPPTTTYACRFKADIQWNGDRIVHRYLESLNRQNLYKNIMEAACAAPGEENAMLRDAMDVTLHEFGTGVISTVGAEIDRLEIELTKICPGLLYVDLETERISGASNFLSDRCMLQVVRSNK